MTGVRYLLLVKTYGPVTGFKRILIGTQVIDFGDDLEAAEQCGQALNRMDAGGEIVAIRLYRPPEETR